MLHRGPLVAALAATVLAGCPAPSRTPPASPRPERPAAAPAPRPAPADTERAGGDSISGLRPPAQPRPYARVVTPETRSRSGLFIVHRIGERVLFEIPATELGKPMLVIIRPIAGNGRSSSRVVVWERRGHRVFLREPSHEVHADSARAIHRAVAGLAYGTLIGAYNVEAYGADSAAVIDASRVFTSGEFAGVTGVQSDRTWVDEVLVFPENIDVHSTQTGSTPPPSGAPPGSRPTVSTVRTSWSMVRLPAEPMMPRLHDRRVGYLTTRTIDYGLAEHRATERRYIRRFRLDKRDPSAAVSEPVQPIEFWIDPATPEWLVPWVRAGIEEWQPAFEEAGFRNAIVAREAPGAAADSTWSMHDARRSVVYWRPSTVQNAMGTQTVDPRTGEIIKAEVHMYHNIMQLLRDWYFVQVSPLDVRAQRLPLPDSLMGRLVQYVVAHEVGHAIGFPHNMKASSMYPVDSLRSAAFLERMGGHVATLMDYSRFNYVAQPEDGIPAHLLVPTVGPYDRFAVRWGHAPIPGTRTPDDERPTLDAWARMQDTIPWFRFSTSDATGDPGNLTEAVGDADAVRATSLALRNLERVAGSLLSVAERPGEDYTLLRELYGQMVEQWGRYMSHVAAVIGGAESQERYGTGRRFFPVPRERQREAMRFLSANAFRPPPYFLDKEILRRIESEGAIERIRRAQASVLTTLLAEGRLNRLIEYEATAPSGTRAYTVAEMLGDLRRGVWTELSATRVEIGVHRRNLQRAYLEVVESRVAPGAPRPGTGPAPVAVVAPPRGASDARPILRGELVELDREVERAIRRAADPMTRLHLQDVHLQIRRILDPRLAE